MKRFLNFTNLMVTLFIFFFMWGFGKIGVQFEFLNVFEQVFENFELTDIYYSKFRKDDDVKFEDRVVLVNLGKSSRTRGEIAMQIAILNEYNPKVIGIDAFFRKPKTDSLGIMSDQFLAAVINDTENFVMVSQLNGYDSATNTWDNDTGANTIPLFRDIATTGFANTVTEEGGNEAFNTWKKVRPKQKLKNGTTVPSFAAQITSFYDSAARSFCQEERENNIFTSKEILLTQSIIHLQNIPC